MLGEVEAVEAGVEELEEGGEGVQLGVVQTDPPLYALLHTRGQGTPEPGTPGESFHLKLFASITLVHIIQTMHCVQ